MTDTLEGRVAALEKSTGLRRNTPAKLRTGPSLQECNKRALAEADAIRAEKRDAENVAVTAVRTAFKTRAGKLQPQRVQKNISPVAAELAAKDKAK